MFSRSDEVMLERSGGSEALQRVTAGRLPTLGPLARAASLSFFAGAFVFFRAAVELRCASSRGAGSEPFEGVRTPGAVAVGREPRFIQSKTAKTKTPHTRTARTAEPSLADGDLRAVPSRGVAAKPEA